MSTVSGSQYGVGLITLLVASAIGVGYYQMFWIPEQLATPDVDEHVLHPVKSTIIEMILGSANADQQDNFVPKLVNLQLSIDNHVIWDNVDDTAHTVTPDHRYTDGYSGDFGSTGVIKPGETYEFLFTEAPPNVPVTIEYHCDPHPWMTGTVVVSQARFYANFANNWSLSTSLCCSIIEARNFTSCDCSGSNSITAVNFALLSGITSLLMNSRETLLEIFSSLYDL